MFKLPKEELADVERVTEKCAKAAMVCYLCVDPIKKVTPKMLEELLAATAHDAIISYLRLKYKEIEQMPQNH